MARSPLRVALEAIEAEDGAALGRRIALASQAVVDARKAVADAEAALTRATADKTRADAALAVTIVAQNDLYDQIEALLGS